MPCEGRYGLKPWHTADRRGEGRDAVGLPRGYGVFRGGAQRPPAAAGDARYTRAGHRSPAQLALGAPPARRFWACPNVFARGRGPRRTIRRHRAVPHHGDDLLVALDGGGAGAGGGAMMDLFAVVDQVIELLRSRGRVSYRVLKLQLQLDDDKIEALKDELIYAQHVAVDEDGRVLVWTGGPGATPAPASTPSQSGRSGRHADLPADVTPLPIEPHVPEAERRQLTVMFCDLVDSTALASELDPEEWREVVRAYQDACAKVTARYDWHIAQYLGDGLLVYFGYPQSHEDDAQRAVRAGLGMVEALGQLNMRLAQERGVSLAVRLGCHTGLVVVGDVGGGPRQVQLALGETPNLAARLQCIAAPNTLVISAATVPLLGGFFACQSLGTPLLKGVAQPLEIYQVLSESTARSRLDAAGSTGLTPLIGREPEVALLRERWVQVKEGIGQVVLLSTQSLGALVLWLLGYPDWA